MSAVTNWSRREFLTASSIGAGGLLLGFALPSKGAGRTAGAVAEELSPSAWVSISTDDTVTIWVGEADMGQGVRTALPMILADELEADWDDVQIQQAYPDPRFGNLGTGGSSSVRNAWNPLRKAGATARVMLIGAAAETWGVSASECRAEKGAVVYESSGRSARYGELVAAAAEQPVPEDPPLKDPADFRYIGTAMTMLDTPDRVTGQATYGIDVRLPDMRYASVERCPVSGGTVASLDASAAKAVEGVQDVIEIPAVGPPVNSTGGVAVIASSTWAAFKGREALEITWDEGETAQESTETLRQQFEQLTDAPGMVVRDEGDMETAMSEADRVVEATYELPYLAHATMEPQNCVAHVQNDRVEIWGPMQTPSWAQSSIANALGVEQDAVRVNTTLLGGGFGRRLNPDVPVEAAQISEAIGAPVQVIWKREDDTRHDFYRPASHHRFRAAIRDGEPMAWMHRLSTPAIDTYISGPDAENPEDSEIPGAVDLPYGIPSIRVEYALAESGVPRGWWRSVEHSFNGFVVNAFLDEVAEACGADPYEFRLELLDQVNPDRLEAVMQEHHGDLGPHAFDLERFRNVLTTVAEGANWGEPMEDGRGRGIAVHWSFRTYAAEVVEVSVRSDNEVSVDRVVCAVDCGRVVNPRTVEEQIEGGVMYALTASLKDEITIENGRVVQSNFDDYQMLRIDEAPAVDVHIIDSNQPPSGAGEPGVPPLFGALTGAIYDATGTRIRRLPLRNEMLGKA